MFESIEEVREKLAEQEYVCDRRLATVVYLAVKLDKPVLIEGPAGVGKTELAKSLAEPWTGRSSACNATRGWTRPKPSTSGSMASNSCTRRSSGRR